MRAIIFLFLSLLFLVACGGSPSPSPTPDPIGNLTITITGLPAQADANVTVTGPNNYGQTITGTTTLSNLAVGSYTVTATTVTSGDSTYIPEPAQRTVTVAANATPGVTITYAAPAPEPQPPEVGALTVTVTGLLPGLEANVTITGPNSYAQNVTGTITLSDLVPGDYLITATDVVTDVTTFIPDPTVQLATVAADATATATVNYVEQAPGVGNLAITITGLPAGTNANVSVIGPNNYREAVISSTTLTNLAPGEYSITAETVTAGGTAYRPAPPAQTETVTVGATANATVTYQTQAPGCIVNIPDLNLQGAVREALNKPTGDISCLEMRQLTTLTATDRNRPQHPQLTRVRASREPHRTRPLA